MTIDFRLFLLLLVVCSGCATMDSFLFEPEVVERYALPGNTIPDSLIEPVTLLSDGTTIYGFWVRSDGGRPGTTILYCHGNSKGIDNYWDRVMYLHRLGVNVFIFDYRGFGRSEGTSSQAGLFADGRAALEYVRSRSDFDPDSLILYGFSLGNVVSIHLATTAVDPLRLIAESPFASANSLTQGGAGLDLPAGWLTEANFDNASAIRSLRAPFLLLHGRDDDFVRYIDNGRVVYENAPDPKQQIVVDGARHSNIPETLGVENYLALLRAFIGP